MRKLTTNEFIKKAKQVHGDKYDYSLVNYVGSGLKVKIICNDHGVFNQIARNHLSGKGCVACGKIKERFNVTNNIIKKRFENLIQPNEYKLIPLKSGKLTKVDNDDFELLSKYNWREDVNGYVINDKIGRIHRYITKAEHPFEVDHINHDILDNRKANLRVCTSGENNMNQKIRVGLTSKYKGVCWDKERNKWKSCIRINNKTINLGRFNNELDAAKAYNEKAKELFREFAYLNNI